MSRSVNGGRLVSAGLIAALGALSIGLPGCGSFHALIVRPVVPMVENRQDASEFSQWAGHHNLAAELEPMTRAVEHIVIFGPSVQQCLSRPVLDLLKVIKAYANSSHHGYGFWTDKTGAVSGLDFRIPKIWKVKVFRHWSVKYLDANMAEHVSSWCRAAVLKDGCYKPHQLTFLIFTPCSRCIALEKNECAFGSHQGSLSASPKLTGRPPQRDGREGQNERQKADGVEHQLVKIVAGSRQDRERIAIASGFIGVVLVGLAGGLTALEPRGWRLWAFWASAIIGVLAVGFAANIWR